MNRDELYEELLAVAKRRTAQADVKLDERGKPVVEDEELDLGENVLIVDHQVARDAITEPPPQKK